MLYTIRSEDYSIQALAFSADSYRLPNIRGVQCRVWDPPVLVKEDSEEVNSATVSTSTARQEVSMESIDDMNPITSLTCHGAGHVFFCSQEDRSIYVCENTLSQQDHRLCSHADGFSILSFSLDGKSNVFGSRDTASRIMLHNVVLGNQQLENAKLEFDHSEGVTVDQKLTDGGCSRLLVFTAEKQTH